ncbi:MAG: hypothetical protein ACRC7N_14780 [Clostridium sp.]
MRRRGDEIIVEVIPKYNMNDKAVALLFRVGHLLGVNDNYLDIKYNQNKKSFSHF